VALIAALQPPEGPRLDRIRRTALWHCAWVCMRGGASRINVQSTVTARQYSVHLTQGLKRFTAERMACCRSAACVHGRVHTRLERMCMKGGRRTRIDRKCMGTCTTPREHVLWRASAHRSSTHHQRRGGRCRSLQALRDDCRPPAWPGRRRRAAARCPAGADEGRLGAVGGQVMDARGRQLIRRE
jgi:hypothetical protein